MEKQTSSQECQLIVIREALPDSSDYFFTLDGERIAPPTPAGSREQVTVSTTPGRHDLVCVEMDPVSREKKEKSSRTLNLSEGKRTVYYRYTETRWYHFSEQQEEDQPKSGGCYVATAVYDSYNCPEVWTLRRFRDQRLMATLPGRAFVRTYYAVSPTLVKWFGNTEWFRQLWKPKLDRLVLRLRAQGLEDTPYED